MWCYLNPGLSLFAGGNFEHTYGQCFLYPGFVWLTLKITHDFRALGLLQHFSGLGAGALLWCCWNELRRLLPERALPPAACSAPP